MNKVRTEKWTEDRLIKKDSCFECGSTNGIEYHHVVPYIKGGTKTIPLCESCHSKVHNKNFVEWRALKREGINKAKERGVVFGRREGVKEPIEKWLAKEKTQSVIHYLNNGYSYAKTADKVKCSISLVQKVAKYFKNINNIQINDTFF